MNNAVSLSASENVNPSRDQIRAGIKPYKLTVTFDYSTSRQAHPYGNDVAYEDICDTENIEYFLDGVETPYDELKVYLTKIGLDIDELTDKIIDKAIEEYHK